MALWWRTQAESNRKLAELGLGRKRDIYADPPSNQVDVKIESNKMKKDAAEAKMKKAAEAKRVQKAAEDNKIQNAGEAKKAEEIGKNSVLSKLPFCGKGLFRLVYGGDLCKICNERVYDGTLKDHISKEHGENVRICKLCAAITNDGRKGLIRHNIEHHRKHYVCESCVYKTTVKRAFEKHRQSHLHFLVEQAQRDVADNLFEKYGLPNRCEVTDKPNEILDMYVKYILRDRCVFYDCVSLPKVCFPTRRVRSDKPREPGAKKVKFNLPDRPAAVSDKLCQPATAKKLHKFAEENEVSVDEEIEYDEFGKKLSDEEIRENKSIGSEIDEIVLYDEFLNKIVRVPDCGSMPSSLEELISSVVITHF